MIFDEYRIFNSKLYSSGLIEISFCTFYHVVMSKVFYVYILLVQNPKFKSLNFKQNLIQLTKKWS